MNKIYAILVLGALFAGTALSSTIVGFDVPSGITAGDTFDVGVTFTSDGLVGYNFDVVYPDFLDVLGVTGAGFFADPDLAFTGDVDESTPGLISFLYGDIVAAGGVNCGDDLFCGTDTLATIHFHASSSGNGTISVDSGSVSDPPIIAIDGDFDFDPDVTFHSAEISVGEGITPPAETPEPSTFALLALPLAVIGMRRLRGKAA